MNKTEMTLDIINGIKEGHNKAMEDCKHNGEKSVTGNCIKCRDFDRYERREEMSGTTLMDVKKSIVAELEEKGIEPTSENIIKRLEEMTKEVNENDQ